jgi:hypothetical protein
MTRNDDFIQRLEAYLDEYEGLTPLPSSVRDAVRAEVPRTKQAGPLSGLARYVTMDISRPAQMALAAAAAILLIAGGLFVFNGRNVSGPTEPTPTPTVSATAAPEACDSTTVTAPTAGTIEVVWCAPSGAAGQTERIAFTMDGPEEWFDQVFPDQALFLLPESGGRIALSLQTDQSVEEWVDEVASTPGWFVVEQPSVTIGGLAATVMEVSLEPGTSSGDAPPLIEDVATSWRLSEDSPARVWVVDRNGQALLIVSTENLADALADSLETLSWNP